MEVIVFGKLQCGKCKGAQDRVSFLVGKMGLVEKVGVRFVDVDTVDGRAEGAFFDVYDAVPVTIIRNDGADLGRWEGEAPKTDELAPYFESVNGVSTNQGLRAE
jgi:hypothetical protein